MADETCAVARRNLLPWLPIVAGPALLFGPALVRGEALFWGAPLLQFTPWHVAAKQIVLSGHLPLWNPWLGMGAPLLANYQAGLLYPPNWLLLLTDVAWGQTLLVMLHLIWAGIGTAALGRRLGLSPFARSIAGLAYGMSGYLVARSGFLSINAAAAWLPWIVVASERLIDRRKVGAIAPLALVLGLQWLAGHAQTAWYTMIFAAAWLGFRAWPEGRWRALAIAGGGFGLATILAFALAGLQLVPTLEYLRLSDRSAGLDPEFALNYSFWPWRLVGLLAPDMYGNPRDGNYWGYGNYWEDHIYLGVLPILLAVGALSSRRLNRMRWFFLGVILVSFVLALGRNTPVFPLLFRAVPTFSLFQAPTRWNLLFAFSLALLAGMGAELWQAASGKRLYWLRLGTAGAAAAAGAALLGGRLLSEIEPTFAPAIFLAAIGLLASGALALTRRDSPAPVWTVVAVGITLLDLLFASRGLNPTLPLDYYQRSSSLKTVVDSEHRLYMAETLEQQLKFDLTFRFDTFHPDMEWDQVRDYGLPNTTILDGLRSANNFDPIRPGRYVAWVRAIDSASALRRDLLLRHTGIGWQAVLQGGSVQYEPLTSPVRAWVVPKAEWVSDEQEAILKTTKTSFEPRESVVLEGAAHESPQGGRGEILSLNDRNPNLVEVSVSAPDSGWLVLADSWFPGWKARVDGAETEILPANGLLRSIWLPPGQHTVVFSYQPTSVFIGLALSLLGWPALYVLRRL